MSGRPVVFDYFKQSADVLLSDYRRSRQEGASDDIGANREHFCSEFLSRVLPSRIRVNQGGEIIDSQNHRTGQLDIILTRDDTPILHYGTRETFLSEGAFAVIQVKSNLTSGNLATDLSALGRVRTLAS